MVCLQFVTRRFRQDCALLPRRQMNLAHPSTCRELVPGLRAATGRKLNELSSRSWSLLVSLLPSTICRSVRLQWADASEQEPGNHGVLVNPASAD